MTFTWRCVQPGKWMGEGDGWAWQAQVGRAGCSTWWELWGGDHDDFWHLETNTLAEARQRAAEIMSQRGGS